MPVYSIERTADIIGKQTSKACHLFSDAAVKRTRKRIVCYYTNWSVYRQGLAKYQPANINPHLCTHLIYAFGTFNDDFQLEPADKYQDIEKGEVGKTIRRIWTISCYRESKGRVEY